MRRSRSSCAALAFATALVLYARAGDGPPMLTLTELPFAVGQGCDPSACGQTPDLLAHYLGKTRVGHLFIVRPAACAGACRAWLVEETPTGTTALLTLEGRYRLAYGGGAYPEVQVRKDIDAARIAYSRYLWRTGAYVQVEAKDLYRVDERECGTREECNQAAMAALRSHHVGQALKIWETVNGVSWI